MFSKHKTLSALSAAHIWLVQWILLLMLTRKPRPERTNIKRGNLKLKTHSLQVGVLGASTNFVTKIKTADLRIF